MVKLRKVAVAFGLLGTGWIVGFFVLGVVGLFGDPNKPMTTTHAVALFVPAAALYAIAGICALVYRLMLRGREPAQVVPANLEKASSEQEQVPAEVTPQTALQETSVQDESPQISATTIRLIGVAQLALIPLFYVMLRGEPGAEDGGTRLLLAYAIWGAPWGHVLCWPRYVRTVDAYSMGKRDAFTFLYWFGPYSGVSIVVGILGGGIYMTIKCLLYRENAPKQKAEEAAPAPLDSACPHCGSSVDVDVRVAKVWKCPQCGEFFRPSRSLFDDAQEG